MKSIIKMVTISLFLIYMDGCGSSSDSERVTQSLNNQSNEISENNNSNTEGSKSQSHTLSYKKADGLLIESLENGKNLYWVNSRSDVCKISRPEDRSSSVYDDAQKHCQKLSNENYASISTWRVPTLKEASHLMSNVDLDKILYPDSNPNCAIMATDSENTFVYTTSSWNSSESVGKSFISSERNNKVAGIRCVSGE